MRQGCSAGPLAFAKKIKLSGSRSRVRIASECTRALIVARSLYFLASMYYDLNLSWLAYEKKYIAALDGSWL